MPWWHTQLSSESKGGEIRIGDGRSSHPLLSHNLLWHLDLAMN